MPGPLAKNFTIFKNQRFDMKLENGYGIEVKFGPLDMCGNFSRSLTNDHPAKFFTYSCDDCELVITKDTKVITRDFLATHMDNIDNQNVTSDVIAKVLSIMILLEE